ncbi:MAG: signal peptide peptidase SppA [Pseudomonadota bacterium]
MSAVGQFFGGVGFVFDLVRKVMHFIVLALFFLILGASFTGETPPPVPSGAALLLDFDGPLVEQLSGDPVDRAVEELQGAPIAGVLVRQLVRAIDTAAEDDRISAIVMRLERLGGGGLTKYQLVADALDRFRASGKSVIVYGDGYTQSHYFLAAHADEVYLHPSGGVAIDGFGRFRTYYREAIDKLQIDWNVFKVGEYKSFVEPYLRDNMSAEDRASSMVWLNQLWDIYVADVSDARGLSAGVLSAYTENLAANLDKNGGNVAALAVDAGLVDALKNRDEFRSDMNGRFGPDSTTGTYKHIPFSDYIVAQGLADPVVRPGTDAVGVIVASGQILDGRQPSGTIGGDSLADLVRQATADNSLKGLVLVVDSGGGSKFASEVIQRELLGFKATGRPLIAYMSSVAASGGYWISMDADEIWANEATITGSIGIGGFFPTFQRSLDSLGIHVDGIGTT